MGVNISSKKEQLFFDITDKQAHYSLVIDGKEYGVTNRARQTMSRALEFHDWCDHIPVGADGRLILPGETVYGEDGLAWTVLGISTREQTFEVKATDGETVTRLRSEWLTHEPQSEEQG